MFEIVFYANINSLQPLSHSNFYLTQITSYKSQIVQITSYKSGFMERHKCNQGSYKLLADSDFFCAKVLIEVKDSYILFIHDEIIAK